MNRENFEKLLQANRETPAEAFDMAVFCSKDTGCGTRACMLGNYALRADLQSVLRAEVGWIGGVEDAADGNPVQLDGPLVCEHFGITPFQARALFEVSGCDGADQDRDKAIAYVEQFLASGGETPGYTEDEDEDEDEDCECESCSREDYYEDEDDQ